MSENLLAPLTALGKTVPVIKKIGGITISENPDLAIVSLSARMGTEQDLQNLLKPLLGAGLPGPGQAQFAEDITAIWVGVHQWFLMASLSDHPDYADEINNFVTDAASVTEQSDGWAVFDITGDNLVPLLERICNLNSKAMSSGDATRCLIEHLGCLIICRESVRNFTILGPRSSAASLHHTFVTAAHSVA